MTAAPESGALAPVVFGLSHVVVPVAEIQAAYAFYVDGLGFPVLAEQPGWVDLEAGMTTIRLSAHEAGVTRVALRLRAVSVSGALERAAALGASVTAAIRTSDLELTGCATDPDGNELVFWRPLSEDEYEEPVPLPKKLSWTTEADALMQSLLSAVPALFRATARTGAVAEAEYLTEPESPVEIEAVVRAYIRATPRILRSRLRTPLQARGFDVDRYRSDFEV